MSEKARKINQLSMIAVTGWLGVRLYSWASAALKDGELDSVEAAQLAEPIAAALNDVVELPYGQVLHVEIKIVDMTL